MGDDENKVKNNHYNSHTHTYCNNGKYFIVTTELCNNMVTYQSLIRIPDNKRNGEKLENENNKRLKY